MTDVVIDTNVWAMIDKTIADVNTAEELDCIKACQEWIKAFISGDDRLAVDTMYKILGEYRQNIKKGGLAEQYLNRLESQPRDRIKDKEIEFDVDGYAILPDDWVFHDPSDCKFIAVSISFDPYAPIYNATDTDWEKEKPSLQEKGLIIHELCPDYIEVRIKS